MQNKPNSPDAQMNATSVTTNNYNYQKLGQHRKNKSNQTQFTRIDITEQITNSGPIQKNQNS